MAEITLAQMHDGLNRSRFAPSDLTMVSLQRIAEVNDKVRAVTEVFEDASAHAKAKASACGPVSRPILHGVPILVKNQIATIHGTNTNGSTAFPPFITEHDADVVTRLKSAGAVIIGKANLSQWGNCRATQGGAGHGWSADGGQTLGVYHQDQDPWGSSSGSAVATALGMCFAALGTEVRPSYNHHYLC